MADAWIGRNFNTFINMAEKQANMETDNFYAILNGVKSWGADNLVYTTKAMNNNEIDYDKPIKALINPLSLYSPAMCNNGTMAYENLVHLVNDEGGALFTSASFLPVVNNNSANKELAADFIRFLLSDEMQTSPELLFCPVNKDAVSEVSYMTYEESKAGGWLPDGFTEETLENNIAVFAKMTDSLAIYGYQERFLNSLIYDELSEFFMDRQTAEQTAANLEASVNSYLNE